MRPRFKVFALFAAILAGCQPSKVATTPTTPLVHQHKWGNYVIEYDEMLGTDYSFRANFEDDDNGNQMEVIDLTIDGKNRQLRVRSGTVSLNGVDYGPVQKGDRVKLAADGKVFVNGTERRP
jgi:hypothetical protein